MVDTRSQFKVLGICGSLRAKSTNLTALKIAGDALSAHKVVFEILNYNDLPIYNGDIEADGMPDLVKALYSKIKESDGVVIASPEYNYSISSALKNLIDWVSRIQPSPFDMKPVAIFSVTAGPSGGARSQYDLRKMMVFLNGFVLQKPEVMIGSNYLKFDEESNLKDEAPKKYLVEQMAAFIEHITFVKKGLAK